MSDVMERLRGLADLFEAGDAPRHVVLHMRAGADEIERLRTRLEVDPSHPYDGIYARDETIRGLEKQIESLRQKTQYWPDNAERDAVIRHQKEEIERLRAALEEIAYGNPLHNENDLMRIARAALEKEPTDPGPAS